MADAERLEFEKEPIILVNDVLIDTRALRAALPDGSESIVVFTDGTCVRIRSIKDNHLLIACFKGMVAARNEPNDTPSANIQHTLDSLNLTKGQE